MTTNKTDDVDVDNTGYNTAVYNTDIKPQLDRDLFENYPTDRFFCLVDYLRHRNVRFLC